MTLFLFLLFFISVVLSFYFSGTEAGFIALNKQSYGADLSRSYRPAQRIRRFVENPSRVLMLVLFGNNLANIATVYLATNLWLRFYGEEKRGVFLATVTVFLLFISEIAPKVLFRTYANTLLYATANVLYFFEFLFSPFLGWFNFLSVRSTSEKSKQKMESDGDEKQQTFVDTPSLDFSKEDFVHIIQSGKDEGAFSEKQVSFMNKLATLSQVKTLELMKPLADLVIFHIDQDINLVRKSLRKEDMALIPVYEKRIDNIVGYIDTLDIFSSGKKKKIIKDYVKIPTFIPDICTIDKIYHHFQDSHNHLLVAVNEYGGCSGVLTEEDVVANVFGLRYQKTKEKGEKIRQVSPTKFRIDTSVDIDDLNEMLNLKIRKKGFETLGGFVNYIFQGLASRGASHYFRKMKFKVLRTTPTSVEEVELTFQQPQKIANRKIKKEKG